MQIASETPTVVQLNSAVRPEQRVAMVTLAKRNERSLSAELRDAIDAWLARHGRPEVTSG